MFNTDNIYARLQNGENPEAVANEMAAALNEAIARKNKEDEDAKRKNNDCTELLTCAIDDVLEYMSIKYPELTGLFEDQIPTEVVAEAIDALAEELIPLAKFKGAIGKLLDSNAEGIPNSKVFEKSTPNASPDDIIGAFLKTLQ